MRKQGTLLPGTIDIKFNKPGAAGQLSNFTERSFVFRGVRCHSIEGVLQGIKSANIETQKARCLLFGVPAKRSGKAGPDWKEHQTLYWAGEPMGRQSELYKQFLNELYNAVYDQCADFRAALAETGDAELIHSIAGGKTKPETVLIEEEFIDQLLRLRCQ